MAILIGIPSRIRMSNFLPFMGISESYIQSVTAAGGVPYIIPLNSDPEAVKVLYKLSHGILLPGGEDVNPSLYGESPHRRLGTVCPRRDRMESQLIKMAKEDKKPLLAICRGTQILNAALNGTLYQDLPEQLGAQGHSNNPPQAWTAKSHSLKIENGSKLFKILATDTCEVNSLHHQAVKQVAPGFRAVAHSPDGVIEAIESTDDWFAIGIQSHPETLWQETEPVWKKLFAEFISICRKFKDASC